MWQCLLVRIWQALPTESNQFVASLLQNRFQRAWHRVTAHQESQWAHIWEFCQRMYLTPELNPAAVLLLSPRQTAGQHLCGKQLLMGLQENNYLPFPCLVCSSVCFELVTPCLAPSCTWGTKEPSPHFSPLITRTAPPPWESHPWMWICNSFIGDKYNWETNFCSGCIPVCMLIYPYWFSPASRCKDITQKYSDPCQETKQLSTFRHKEHKRKRVQVLCCLAKSGKGRGFQDSMLHYSWEGWF